MNRFSRAHYKVRYRSARVTSETRTLWYIFTLAPANGRYRTTISADSISFTRQWIDLNPIKRDRVCDQKWLILIRTTTEISTPTCNAFLKENSIALDAFRSPVFWKTEIDVRVKSKAAGFILIYSFFSFEIFVFWVFTFKRSEMSEKDRSSPIYIDHGLKTLIGRADNTYPLISGEVKFYYFI